AASQPSDVSGTTTTHKNHASASDAICSDCCCSAEKKPQVSSTKTAPTMPKCRRACNSTCRSAHTHASPRSTAVSSATFQFQWVSGNSSSAIPSSRAWLRCCAFSGRILPPPLSNGACWSRAESQSEGKSPLTGHYISHNFQRAQSFRHRHGCKFFLLITNAVSFSRNFAESAGFTLTNGDHISTPISQRAFTSGSRGVTRSHRGSAVFPGTTIQPDARP